MTRLVHYSDALVLTVRDTPQRPELEAYGKPRGLWVSADDHADNWRDWCLSEGFGLSRLTHVHDVELVPGALGGSVLHLDGAGGLDRFTREFARSNPRYSALGLADRGHFIDWPAVAARWDGIVIAPYVWERRLHEGTGFYYTWDCASGCLWRARAVASITLREVVPAAVPQPEPEEAD